MPKALSLEVTSIEEELITEITNSSDWKVKALIRRLANRSYFLGYHEGLSDRDSDIEQEK